MSNKPASSRHFEIEPNQLSARQRAIVERIESGPRGRLPINLRAWLHNPDFVDVVEPFGLYVSALAPITKRQKEILVLTGARFWQAAYELHMHEGHAVKAGITSEQVARIKAGESPGFTDPLEQLTWELGSAIHSPGPVPEPLYRRCMDVLGHKGVSDLIGLAGLYTMIAMTLNFHDVVPPLPAKPIGEQS
jgi:4-carboxymuconolactone decarboxylase